MKGKILYTREAPLAEEIAELFSAKQFEFISIPMIQTLPIPYELPAQDFDWIFFTSGNTVKYFDFSRLAALPKVLAIGSKTASALREKGIRTDFLPDQFHSEALIRQWCREVSRPQRICFPQSQLARPVIRDELEKMGHQVAAIPIYRTVFPSQSGSALHQLFAEDWIDYAIFASPSAWENFYPSALAFGRELISFWQTLRLVSIGPVTTEAILKSGERVWLEADIQDMDVLLKKLLQEIER